MKLNRLVKVILLTSALAVGLVACATNKNKAVAVATKHEIASHSFFHSSFKKEDLKNSRQVLEAIISKKVHGLRMPGMEKIEAGCIKEAGYTYDSSINPTWVPGVFNKIRSPRTCYSENGIARVPVSSVL